MGLRGREFKYHVCVVSLRVDVVAQVCINSVILPSQITSLLSSP